VCELLVESWARSDFNTLIEFLRQIYSRTYTPVGTRIVLTLPELSNCESPALYYGELDVLYECSYNMPLWRAPSQHSYSEPLDLATVNAIRAQRGHKMVERVVLSDIQAIQPFSIACQLE
jgi:hypothetical protein